MPVVIVHVGSFSMEANNHDDRCTDRHDFDPDLGHHRLHHVVDSNNNVLMTVAVNVDLVDKAKAGLDDLDHSKRDLTRREPARKRFLDRRFVRLPCIYTPVRLLVVLRIRYEQNHDEVVDGCDALAVRSL